MEISPTSPSRTPVWIKAFVAFHLVAITVWSLPNPGTPMLRGDVRPVGTDVILVANARHLKTFDPIRFYVSATGFWQYWDMFAPNPASIDQYGTATVTYRDGTTREYPYPRMYLLSIPEKHVKERYRKFFERVSSEDFMYVWTAFAQRIAREMNVEGNPPVQVDLYRHFRRVAPPGSPAETEYASVRYFRYAVEPNALKGPR